MEKHIISNYLKVDHSIREAIIYMVEVRERKISSGVNVKCQNNDQTILEDFYKNSDLSKERKEDIDTALIKAFVCCSLPWHLVEHLFIIELFKQLRSNYSLPDRKTLADTILTQEILRVNPWMARRAYQGNLSGILLFILLIIEEIGIQKFAAHSLNLITKDLIKHTFAKKIIQWCSVIVTYFKKLHRPKELLELKILEKQIDGEGLKTYLNTR
ncbi:hypothetical protein C1646_755936 [Rhizophagus diaphanus]|nr:hypothetical protein C1646_755936 [Rhizophagus diaphanus] [Rhizophagus sp. MUCL 43196]